MTLKHILTGAALASGLIATSAPAATQLLGTVTAAYDFDGVTTDGPVMYVTNTTATAFDSVRIYSLFGPNSPGFEDLGPIGGFGRAFVPFTDNTGTTAFASDPDEGGLLDNVYAVVVTQGGQTYWSSFFSPSNNSSGGCVPFLGLNCDYSAEDVSEYPTQVAIITADIPALPEPATWATMLVGLGIAGASLRRRKAHTA